MFLTLNIGQVLEVYNNMAENFGFFDLGLSDLVSALASIEGQQLANSLNIQKQMLAQQVGILTPEKDEQTVRTIDLTDRSRNSRNVSMFSGAFYQNQFVYFGAMLLGAVVLLRLLR